jgi:hypothetical protein
MPAQGIIRGHEPGEGKRNLSVGRRRMGISICRRQGWTARLAGKNRRVALKLVLEFWYLESTGGEECPIQRTTVQGHLPGWELSEVIRRPKPDCISGLIAALASA